LTPIPERSKGREKTLSAAQVESSIALDFTTPIREALTTYLHAHLELKESALAKLKPYERAKAERFRPNDRLLEFLNAL
jgi:hypothetical protein